VGFILAGERDPQKLAELSHPRIQASREEIAKSRAICKDPKCRIITIYRDLSRGAFKQPANVLFSMTVCIVHFTPSGPWETPSSYSHA
jgi:hypothetical protein